ncbi:D-alanyl-D-alanine carboxypeptidase/D-alanyl-D-alanine-endopeptidase [Subtercola sp. Z020]|uniref:D-alanyl-D-alanine carboxypeptidase/D-alanyl-D-alanine-endopeptidase n=1 Tax=Subtercola sp. Z020 TaxID=2080582 RepID=UPI001E50B29E|nr:D-alanyl-D-alanine carboxypeptidase [Subtercola sp. Z020]
MPGHSAPQNSRSRHRRLRLNGGWALFALLAGGSLAGGAAFAAAQNETTPVVAASATAPTPRATSTVPVPQRRPQPTTAAAPTIVRTCSVDALASAAGLGTFQGTIRDAASGSILFDRDGDTFSRTASVMKVLTSAAALTVLGPDYRVTTTVLKGEQGGEVVLVGGGDVTLASGTSNIYNDSASMLELADQVKAAWAADPATAGSAISTITLDSSLFTGDTWQPSWDRVEQTEGSTAEVTALMVDGDRSNPSADTSPRSDDPVARAGQAFKAALGSVAVGARLGEGAAPAGAASLGAVQSAPVSTMVQEAVLRSDNTEAEMLARLTAIKRGAGSSFTSLQAAIPAALSEAYGLDAAGLVIVDGSGLSDDDAVSAEFITALLDRVNARDGSLGVLLDGLPIADQTGTLSYRFTGANSVVNGRVFAKTGSIDSANTLAGVIHAADGSVLTFAFFALNSQLGSGREALDALTVGVYNCGNALSNN